MSVFHLVLAAVWLFVSVTFAVLARWKYKSSMDVRIWPDVLASVSAAGAAIAYLVEWWAS